jgi:hypothetical protein
MRRSVILVSLLAIALAGFASVQWASVAAQDARFINLPEDVKGFEVSGFTQIPSTFMLEYEPGASIAYDGEDRVIYLVYVQSGTVTLRTEAPLAIMNADTTDTPEILDAGVERVLETGKHFVLGPHVPVEIRNDGDEPASLQYAMMDRLDPIVVDPNEPLG